MAPRGSAVVSACVKTQDKKICYLAEFVPEKKPQTETPSVVIPETEKKPEAEKPEKKADKAENQTGALLAIGLLAAGGAGAYYYFKVAKPKKAETDAEDEDLEFYNGPYINEDAEDAEETEE